MTKTRWLRCPVAPAFAVLCDFQVGAAANVAGATLQCSWLGGLWVSLSGMHATGAHAFSRQHVTRWRSGLRCSASSSDLRLACKVLDCMIRDKERATAELPKSLQCQLGCDVRFEFLKVLKKNLFSVFLAADDRDESEISFGECRPEMAPLCWELDRMRIWWAPSRRCCLKHTASVAARFSRLFKSSRSLKVQE